MHHGLTRRKVMTLAYELAKRNNLKYPTSWDKNQQAGVDWLSCYMKRYPDLSIRKPEATSLGRATGFNRTTVTEFFSNLSKVYSKFPGGPLPQNIYNLDETALTTVHNPPKIVGQKGLKQIGQVTSGERGVLVTACCFINAAGNSVPPFLVFPRVHFKERMLRGGPPGTAGGAAKSGWVNSDIFIDILKHFHASVKSTPESPILLILDNHESHISIGSLEFCKTHGIMLLTLPPHTSGKLQPLDKSVYKSLKTNFNSACNDWMVMHPGKTITIYEIAELLGTAYPKAFTPNNIINGFRSTGIWPFHQDIFTDDDFLCSAVTDRPHDNATELVEFNDLPRQPSPVPSSSRGPHIELQTPEHSPQRTTEQQQASQIAVNMSLLVTSKPTTSAISFITPDTILPFPKASPRKESRKRNRKRKSQILTETPIKDQIIEDIKNKKSVKRNVFKGKQKLAKRMKDDTTSESEDGSVSVADSCDSTGPFISDEELDMNIENIDIGDYVLLNEGAVKSIGKIITKFDLEINVQYIKRLFPAFKFVETEEEYCFEKSKVIAKLPIPRPFGGTARRSEMLVFQIDLHHYDNELK